VDGSVRGNSIRPQHPPERIPGCCLQCLDAELVNVGVDGLPRVVHETMCTSPFFPRIWNDKVPWRGFAIETAVVACYIPDGGGRAEGGFFVSEPVFASFRAVEELVISLCDGIRRGSWMTAMAGWHGGWWTFRRVE
jgi:hypothetical protein